MTPLALLLAVSAQAAPVLLNAKPAPRAGPVAPGLAAPPLRAEALAALSSPALLRSLDARALPAPAPAGPLGALARRVARAVAPPVLTPAFEGPEREQQYHGTSLAALTDALFDGAALRRHSYFSDEPSMTQSYARGHARESSSPGVVLQFRGERLRGSLELGHYQPTVSNDRVPTIIQLANYRYSTEPVPLSALTDASKRAVLRWLEVRAELAPQSDVWSRLREAFASAFGPLPPEPRRAPGPEEEFEAALSRDPASLGLEGLRLRREHWTLGGARLTRLGQGSVGFVDAHPRDPDAVVKTVAPAFEQFMFAGLTVKTAAVAEFQAARALEAAGVGPRVLGWAVAGEGRDRRYVTTRERVRGATMAALAAERRFGPEEEALVLDMLRRMAVAGALVTDIKPENVMIGTTARDPVRRAWFVDGGMVEAFPPGLDADARYEKLLDYPNVVAVKGGLGGMTPYEVTRSIRSSLADARADAEARPWWRRALRAAGRAFLAGQAMGVRQ